MRPRSHLVVVLVLLGLASAMLEECLIHTDDGCVLETHCNACLLQLGTPAIAADAFSLPPVAATGEPLVRPAIASREQPEPETLPSRGPPAVGRSFV